MKMFQTKVAKQNATYALSPMHISCNIIKQKEAYASELSCSTFPPILFTAAWTCYCSEQKRFTQPDCVAL
jgi:hypothetical protein